MAGSDVTVTFTAQAVPVSRGILSTLYAPVREGVTLASIEEAYAAFYADAPFVRLCDASSTGGTAAVRGSNSCDLMITLDSRSGLLRVVSMIDNLMKGQAGNALQTMNLLLGFPQQTGLDRCGQYP